jgi:hypothetical protein
MSLSSMSNDEFHEAAVRGCESMHRRGLLTDQETADQRAWWASGGHLDRDDDCTVTLVATNDREQGLER